MPGTGFPRGAVTLIDEDRAEYPPLPSRFNLPCLAFFLPPRHILVAANCFAENAGIVREW